jgi:hypothetical protein
MTLRTPHRASASPQDKYALSKRELSKNLKRNELSKPK